MKCKLLLLVLLFLVLLLPCSYAAPSHLSLVGGNSTAPSDVSYNGTGNDTHDNAGHVKHDAHGIHVAKWNFDYVASPLIITLFIFIVALSKVGYHHANFLSSYVPESCILIILGTLLGVCFHFLGSEESISLGIAFQPRNFFLFLLPPIILDAAYSLHDRTFFDNIGTVLVFAVVGTIINWVIIGPALYGLSVCGAMGEIELSLVNCFTFSALIVAVDPVAVLAIFEEIGVNNVLYFLVFGESLLNDAVTVVIYNMMKTFANMDEIPPIEMFKGFMSFFTISLGGLSIGILIGLLSAFILKYTSSVRVVEPLLLFVGAYLSYLCAELFHFSGIISMIGCGLIQAQYAFHNVSHKSHTTVKYFSKMQSAVCEAVIFMYLGHSIVSPTHIWQTGFIIWTVVLTLVVRFVTVFLLSFLANRYSRVRKIEWHEQFIMAYGGLRGAVSFSLAVMLDSDVIGQKDLFITATLTVVLFTVFIQGSTIKPLVKLLHIATQAEKSLSMVEEIHSHVQDHLLAGLEEVIGHMGHNTIREKIDWIDDNYLKQWLQREPMTKADHIMEMYEKIALEQHYASLPGSKVAAEFAMKNLTPEPSLGGSPEPPRMLSNRSNSIFDRSADFERESFHPELLDNHRTRRLSMFSTPRHSVQVGDSVSRLSEDLSSPSRQKGVDQRALRKILSWRPEEAIHKQYNRNLHNDDDQDLLHHLTNKRLLTRRLTLGPAASPRDSFLSLDSPSPQPQPPSSPLLQPIREDEDEEPEDDDNCDSQERPDGVQMRVKNRRKNLKKAFTIDLPGVNGGHDTQPLTKESPDSKV